MLYPLRFEPVYISKPWGGRGLERFKDDLPPGDIGETWDVSAHPEGDTVIANGPLRGRRLSEVATEHGPDLLGSRCTDGRLPVMVRYVCSRENLSIQLHPTSTYARKAGLSSGKDEAWYILDADPGAFVYAGLKDCTVRRFRSAAEDGSLADLLVKHPVSPGDFISIPAGTVHAICAGVTLIEICENSNVTYRLYDYNRNRGLDLEEGFEVVNVDAEPTTHRGIGWRDGEITHTVLCLRAAYAIEKLEIAGVHAATTDPGSFSTVTCINGGLTLAGDFPGGSEHLVAGQSLLLPATLGRYTLTGAGSVLESHRPDLAAERSELTNRIV